jgi:hypothetical protein
VRIRKCRITKEEEEDEKEDKEEDDKEEEVKRGRPLVESPKLEFGTTGPMFS